MIQYGLLFALGFLAAIFLVFLMAPAIHSRIVWYTEKRLRATVPLSVKEMRAQKDMVRATYAAENAKTLYAFSKERERRLALQIQHERMQVEIDRLKSELVVFESSKLTQSKKAQAQILKDKTKSLNQQIETLQKELAARDREIEGLKLQARIQRYGNAGVQHEAEKKPIEVMNEPTIKPDEMRDQLVAAGADLADKLAQASSPEADAQLREDIAAFAAQMIAWTADQEGVSSPLYAILDRPDSNKDGMTLAGRAKRILSQQVTSAP